MNINSFFDKNKFGLNEYVKDINNIPKEECFNTCIENKYQGFTYKGDKNKCLLYNSHKFNTKLKKNEINKFNTKTFLKTKDIVDIENIKDQHDSTKYFTQINNNDFEPDNFIKDVNVSNQKECMDECMKDYSNCKSILYLEQPKSCSFFNKKIMQKNDSDTLVKGDKEDKEDNGMNRFDTYTTRRERQKRQESITLLDSVKENSLLEEVPIKILNQNIPIYNCAGLYSTNPFCTQEYNPNESIENNNMDKKYVSYTDCISSELINSNKTIMEQNKMFNNICKKKYGNEYVFDDNIYNTESVLDCDNGEKRVKCNINFNDISENILYNDVSDINRRSPIEHYQSEIREITDANLQESISSARLKDSIQESEELLTKEFTKKDTYASIFFVLLIILTIIFYRLF